jgi:hypothetical protein
LSKNKIKTVKVLNIIKLEYSEMKIIENNPPSYSVLNPLTNSDSPSLKSKGVRFLSAKQLHIHAPLKVKNNKKGGRESFICSSLKLFSPLLRRKILKANKIIEIS